MIKNAFQYYAVAISGGGLPGGVCPGGVYPGGVCPGGVWPGGWGVGRGRGGVSTRGCLPGGCVCWEGVCWGVSATHPHCEQNDRCLWKHNLSATTLLTVMIKIFRSKLLRSFPEGVRGYWIGITFVTGCHGAQEIDPEPGDEVLEWVSTTVFSFEASLPICPLQKELYHFFQF